MRDITLRNSMLLLLGGGAMLLAVLTVSSLRTVSPHTAGALEPADNSQAISGFFDSGEMSGVVSAAGTSEHMLIGGAARSSSAFTPKLIAITQTGIENLAFALKNFSSAAIETIAYDGHTWLVGGGDPFLRQTSSPKLNSYNGTEFTDLSSKVQNYRGSIQALAGNGSSWLIGINGLPSPQGGALDINPGETTTALLRYDGNGATEIASTTSRPDLTGTQTRDIAWNGSYWLIAYESVGGSEASPIRGPLKSRLLRYEGSTLTELTVGKLLHYSIFTLAWNGTTWLVPVYGNATNQTTLWSYDGSTFTQLPQTLPIGVVVSSATWTGGGWLLATTTLENLRTGINRNPGNALDLSKDAAALWEYDGTTLKQLVLPAQMMTINTITYAGTIRTAYIGGVNAQGRVGLFTYEKPQLPEFPDGTLLKTPNNPAVFVIFSNKKKHVPDANIFSSYGYRFEDIKPVDEATLNRIPDVKFIRAANDPRVYYLDRGQKRWLKNEAVFKSYGLPWENILTVNEHDLAVYRNARLVRAPGTEKVYFITGQGLIHHVPNPESFVSYGNRWEDIVEVSIAELQSYEVANLIRKTDDFRVYKAQDGVKYWIQTQGTFRKFGLDPNKILAVSTVEFNSYQEGPPLQ